MLTLLILLVVLLSIVCVRQRAAGEGANLDRLEPARLTWWAVSAPRRFQLRMPLLVSLLEQESSAATRHRFCEVRFRQKIPTIQHRLARTANGFPRPDTRPGSSAQFI